MRKSTIQSIVLAFAVWLFTSCSSNTPDDGTITPIATEESKPTAQATESQEPVSTLEATSIPLFPTGPITLTLWTIEEFAPSDETSMGRLLQNQLLSFQRTQHDVSVEVVVKSAMGSGSVLDYLRTAPKVAPDVLPDMVLMSTEMLNTADDYGVLQPVDQLVSQSTLEALFPVAVKLASVDDVQLGIPFKLNFEHVAFNTSIITDTRPTTWQSIIDSGGPYLFPASENASGTSVLALYLAAGGTISEKDSELILDVDPLTEVLRFIQRANSTQAIPSTIVDDDSLSDVWDSYRTGTASLVNIDSQAFIARRPGLINTSFSAIPGPSDAAFPLIDGWHWAVVTTNPIHQQLVGELIDWLMLPENLGAWSYTSGWLPASMGAFAAWPITDDYIRFAREQILLGIPHAYGADWDSLERELTQAVRDVISGNKSPAAAAADLVP
ncbi:MAG: extracellular solute-binding protein [Chloroflexota bacterium]